MASSDAMRSPASFTEERVSLRERLLDVPDDVPRAAWLRPRRLARAGRDLGHDRAACRLTEPPTLLHLTVILFHEAGHVFFVPFGEALRVAGGTLGQLLIPLVCAVALQRRGDNFGARDLPRLDGA